MDQEADEQERYRAPALDKGLDIIELLAATADGLSQAEIAKALARSPNEIYRMLDRLVRRNYVRRTQEDRYELTLRLFELAHARPPLQRLISQANPALRGFALRAEQAAHLVIRDRNILVAVAQVDSPGYWNVSVRVGSRIGLLNTGSGHVFLAFATPQEQLLMLQEQDPGHPAKLPSDIAQRLDTVRRQGYEMMPSAQVSGVHNISIPIFGPLGKVIAALTCPYTQRLDKQGTPDMEQVLVLLKRAGRELSQPPTA
ncbi:transcriptional regulator [Devosia yakushimensis]|uniref:Transcriptional regulator n=1 Tax=Devosia yakushimensis TaxID=470028 RepID=A0ABQ5UFQ8_9HYPH|nr:IclR family transcriptional regulator [Devosia yakushimensis]GLQ10483.1 transcriptional regulator [Devosia yakushimensis]